MLKSVLKTLFSRILAVARVEGLLKSRLPRPPLENQPGEQSNSDSCNQICSSDGAIQGRTSSFGVIYTPGAFPRILCSKSFSTSSDNLSPA